MKWKHPIDLHKGVTGLFILALMAAFDCWTPTAWVYLGCHGTYGILWVLKSQLFGDRSWERPATPLVAVGLLAGLSFYWVAPVIVVVGRVEAPHWVLGLAVALMVFGTFLHFGSDAQKHWTLAHRPGLVTDGFFARTRNPNYLGEIVIYTSFSLLSLHWLPFAIQGLAIAIFFVPFMRRKDRSISRHPGWEAYRARTGLLLPRLW